MQPNKKLITINDNIDKIKALLHELVLQPRLNAIKWSLITKQTPNIKIGYPGQHLASLITGMEGEKTGARGNDLIDGSEVKSCSRIDQLDVCGDCKSPVARLEEICSNCDSKVLIEKMLQNSAFGFSLKKVRISFSVRSNYFLNLLIFVVQADTQNRFIIITH